jgi:hypothetical protein
MKPTLLMVTLALVTLCLLSAPSAHAQLVGAVLTSQPQVIQVPSHPEHATQKPMAQESNLLGTTAYTFAMGEQPLWQFAPASEAIPLGDIARMLKSEHETAKKAEKVWQN